MKIVFLTASFPPWVDVFAVLITAYFFFVFLKQGFKHLKEQRVVWLVLALIVLPLLLMVHFFGQWDLSTHADFNNLRNWWVVPIQPLTEGAPRMGFNLITCGLLLSLLYVGATCLLGGLSRYYRIKKQGHIMAIHKVLIKLLILIVGLMIYLKVHGINLTPIWVGMGAASIILGIALQEPLSSLFTGVALDLEGVLKRGDWIRMGGEDGIEGKVVEKNWRTTKLMTIQDELVTIPNRVLGTGTILNFSQPDPIHVQRLHVGTSYKDPPIKVKEVLRNILLRDIRIARNPPPSVRTIAYNDFSIDYELRFSIFDHGEHQRIKDSVMTQIWYAFKFYGIEIPFPIRTVHLKEQEHLYREKEEIRSAVEDVQDYLMSLPFLSTYLKHKDFDFLAGNSFQRDYSKDEHVIHRGEMGDALYVVREGFCEVILPDGQRRQIEPGSYFGEMGLMAPTCRTADVLAGSEGARIIRIDRECMQVLFRKYPSLREEFEDVRDRRMEDAGLVREARAEEGISFFMKMARGIKDFFMPW